MRGFLAEMGRSSRQRADEARIEVPLPQVREQSASAPPPRSIGRFGEVFDLIAELKPRSPAVGVLPSRDLAEVVTAYQTGGAGMISILTEPTEFAGSLANLTEARALVDIPLLAKDFLVDPYQVYQARVAGADGVLLIARMLGAPGLDEMLAAAAETEMFTLLEAFDATDLDVIGKVAVDHANVLVGVNCRDLETLDVAPERLGELAALVPEGMAGVAESSIGGPEDAAWAAELGYRAALVGTTLMRSVDPARMVSDMLRQARSAAGVRFP
jgi:indole-3-glycerol phosphate synthase